MKRAITNTHTIKLANAMAELKCQCSNCGHKEVIPVQVDSKVCSYCGHKIHNNSKLYFNYKLRRVLNNGKRK